MSMLSVKNSSQHRMNLAYQSVSWFKNIVHLMAHIIIQTTFFT